MDLIFGLPKIHTFEPNISLIRLFNLIFIYAKPRMLAVGLFHQAVFESGNELAVWAINGPDQAPENYTKAVAEQVCISHLCSQCI